MKIYYASSIRGVQSIEKSYFDDIIVELLLHHGVVLGGSIVNGGFNPFGEMNLSEKEIHDREVNWIKDSDAVIAEVSHPSLGVGYIIGRAMEYNKKVLCIYKQTDKPLSKMIIGNINLKLLSYNSPEDIASIIVDYLRTIKIKVNHAPTIAEVNKSAFHDLIVGKRH